MGVLIFLLIFLMGGKSRTPIIRGKSRTPIILRKISALMMGVLISHDGCPDLSCDLFLMGVLIFF